ncbi:FIP1[V]-like protein [Zingiber officinale]|uniref:FIP1[V]-like protein n=1 Tax=Zingiber officinale TaxID=94328 RepID=UPI001C4C7AC5|nr:FIP1[V]-like protein [Zingiber officinale]
MDDDDDDEFGELYTDVLHSVAESVPAPLPSVLSPGGRIDPLLHAEKDDSDGGDPDGRLFVASRADPCAEAPSSSKRAIPPAMAAAEDVSEEDWMLGRAAPVVDSTENWNDEDDDGTLSSRQAEVGAPSPSIEGEPRVLEEDEEEARVSEFQEGNNGIGVDKKISAPEDGFSLSGGGIEQNLESLDQTLHIPGLSAGTASSGLFAGINNEERKPSQSEDWDSDSEDDLKIVLNDSNHGPLVAERHNLIGIDDDDDDDGEEDLVIVTDEDQHHRLPTMEEQNWSEDSMQPAGDGERKEMSDVTKVTGTAGAAPGARIGYSNLGFHTQHHSMFKYVRPGATPLPGDPASGIPGIPGSARPLGPAPISSQGRGDWRAVSGRGFPGDPKSYNTNFGFPAWANSSARAFGIGLDFTLPSHKTVFDVDIESFEEKPWRYLGVDMSDFFNFGLDEDKWKDYCKRLDQLRLESTMQSKIRVYESGRSEQEYDPDLPPELAAAAGHDISADNGHGKSDGESNFTGQGRGQSVMRAPLPTGRAIQVEGGGHNERLPSIDTRPPRSRDSDAIIEIVPQDLFDDPRMHNCGLEKKENSVERDDISFIEAKKDRGSTESGYTEHFSHASSNHKEMTRKTLLAKEKDESAGDHHHNSKSRSPPFHDRALEMHSEERLYSESSSRRHLNAREQSTDSMSSQSAHSNRHSDQRKETLLDNSEVKQCSKNSLVIDTARELSVEEKSSKQDESSVEEKSSKHDEGSVEEKSSKHDEGLTVVDSMELEEMTSSLHVSSETGADDNLVLPSNTQKLSSQVEPLMVYDTGYDDGLQNSDNSREKSGDSKNNQRQTNGEVLHEGHSSQTGYSKRLQKEDESKFWGRDESHIDDRQNREKNHSISIEKEDASNSHQSHLRGRSYEKRKESESSTSSWQRREDNMHGRQIKDDLMRANNDEMLPRNKSKLKVSDRNRRDEDHSRKHVDGEWRSHSRDENLRHRERDDLLMSRRENKDVPLVKKKRDEEYLRGKADRLDGFQSHRAKEDSGRRKRERNDLHGNRRESETRMRDKTEDHLSSKRKKDDSWRQNREREDRQRLKPHEIALTHRESEEVQGTVSSGRVTENKQLGGNGRNRDDSRSISYDKDYQEKERRRHNELSRRDRREDGMSQNRGRGDAYTNEKHSNADERSSRHERLHQYGDRHHTAEGQQMHRERQRENTSKARDVENKQQNNQVLGKRKHDDCPSNEKRKHDDCPPNEKVYNKHSNKNESNISSTIVAKADPHHNKHEDTPHINSSRKQGDDEPASDDENQSSRRGRSKLERWTSHKERDYDAFNNTQALSTLKENVEDNMVDSVQADELTKNELNNITSELDVKGDAGQIVDKTIDDQDRHLDTVAKLKKRSERFKLPMPRDKDNGSNRKLDTEVQLHNNEAGVDSEIKSERPARKRRWTGS